MLCRNGFTVLVWQVRTFGSTSDGAEVDSVQGQQRSGPGSIYIVDLAQGLTFIPSKLEPSGVG